MKHILTLLLIFSLTAAFSQNDFEKLESEHDFEEIINFSVMPNVVWPKYIGGKVGLDKFIQENIKYPEEAKSKNLTGVVVLSYIINPKGEVINIAVNSKTPSILNNELIRVLKLSKPWIPGKKDGKYAKMKCSISYEFK